MLRTIIDREFQGFIQNYIVEKELTNLIANPYIRYADAQNPEFIELRKTVHPEHHIPSDFLENAVTVLTYFLPLTPVSAGTTEKNSNQCAVYDKGYSLTKAMIPEINAHLISYIKSLGYQAVIPRDTAPVSRDCMVSRWSEKHIGVISGLGTFGLNRQLISDYGCTGRISTLVTTLPVKPDKTILEERCLYKKNGSCGVCIKRCVPGAITENGIDVYKCMKYNENLSKESSNKCALCSRGIPCAYKIP